MDFYESEEYRRKYDGSSDLRIFHALHDHIQGDRVSLIGLEKFRHKVVVDVGAGGGGFLDAICGLAKETIAVEPALFWKADLERQHKHYPSVDSMIASKLDPADMVVSFETIEHVSDPASFLADIYSMLSPDGEVYLTTVNCNSIYDELLKEDWDTFNYRSAHLFYFGAASLRRLFETAGFVDIKISYRHEYDLSNLLLWLRDKRPTGIGKYDRFDKALDAHFRTFIEASGLASTIWVNGRKPC